jgi:hypothetical protein
LVVDGVWVTEVLGYCRVGEGSMGQAITFCQLQVRYLIAFPASSSTSLEISSCESESTATLKAPGGGPIRLILRPSGRMVEPRRWASASFSLLGLKEPAGPKDSSFFSFIDMMGDWRVSLSIATLQSVWPAQSRCSRGRGDRRARPTACAFAKAVG